MSKAGSGFGEDLDVSTTQGALLALPIGFTYLMLHVSLANFELSGGNYSAAKFLLWWAMLPLVISGLWFTLKHRLRNAISILIFTFLLTIAYSIFSRKRRHGISATGANTSFSFHFYRCWLDLLKKNAGKSANNQRK